MAEGKHPVEQNESQDFGLIQTALPGKVLILDDEAMVTTSLRAMLSLETPYEVLCHTHPHQALSELKAFQPDVVISDFLMPEMDGIRFLTEARKQLPDASLILLTGYADKENAIQAINTVGIYRYLEKPWDNEQLKQSIRTGLERTRLLDTLRHTISELTEAKQSLEGHNQQLENKVAEKTRDLKQAYEQLKEISRLREDFVSTLTHDMRTPLLAAIQGIDFFLDGTLGEVPGKQHEVLQVMHGNHQTMLNLVNSLLDIYRYEAGQKPLILDTVLVQPLLDTVAQELMPLITHKHQQLVVTKPQPEGPALTVFADKQELKRVLLNLVGNAIKFTQAGGSIQLAAEMLTYEGKKHVEIRVSDNGPGIPKSDQASLFDRFAQGTSKKRNSGTGLGLYLSRQIIEAHGGSMGLDSTEGKGSTFFLRLPTSAENQTL